MIVPDIVSIADVRPKSLRNLDICSIRAQLSDNKPKILSDYQKRSSRRASSKRKDNQDVDFKYFLEEEVYFDGMGELRIGCDDIIAHIKLLRSFVIDAFIIDWADYYDIHTFELIIECLKHQSSQVKWKDRLKIYPTRFGLLVTTYQKWIIDSMCLEIRKEINKYQVSQISASELNKIIAPCQLLSCLPEHTLTENREDCIRGDKYALFVRLENHSSILLRKFNKNFKDYAEKVYSLYSKRLGKTFFVSLRDLEFEKDLFGETIFIKYDPKDVLDPELNLEKYMEEIDKECEELYKDNNIEKLIMSKI